ncbi:MAG: glycosyltransferase [Eubacteriales bacterium]
MPPITVCIIAKNEESRIEQCLNALTPYHFEIVLVDTGSTDRTISIARRYTNRIYEFQWIDDFSAARNFATSKATNDWILALDCDEILQECNIATMEDFMRSNPAHIGQITRINEITAEDEVRYVQEPLSRFFHKKYYHFVGSIHEQVAPLQSNSAYVNLQLPISILHIGYNISSEEVIEKHNRNITLLQKAAKNEPNNPYHVFQLGQSYQAMEDFTQAKAFYEQAIALQPSLQELYTKILYVSYGNILKVEQQYKEGVTLLEPLRDTFGTYSDYCYLLGMLYYCTFDLQNATLLFAQALSAPEHSDLATTSDLPHYMLARINEQIGAPDLAITFYKKCITFNDANERLNKLLTTTY